MLFKGRQVYTDDFYKNLMDGAYRSAKVYVELLTKYYKPRTVIDVGCGRGAWLKAFRESGAEDLVGLDGFWNNQNNMVESSIKFQPIDLDQFVGFEINKKFELAMSLEVAEHLKSSSATAFISMLTQLSDAVLFGAAYVCQGGVNHINEQLHTYWANKFASFGFVPFDLFRPSVWGKRDVEVWYQQNTFLYLKKDSKVYLDFICQGLAPLSNIEYMNCVHPELYNLKINPSIKISFKYLCQAVKRRLSKIII